ARSAPLGAAAAGAFALASTRRTNAIAARSEANDARPATETPRNPLLFTAASFPPLAGGRIMPHEADERVRLGSANRRAGSRRPARPRQLVASAVTLAVTAAGRPWSSSAVAPPPTSRVPGPT